MWESQWLCVLALQSKGLSRAFSDTTVQHQFFSTQAFFTDQLSHPYVTTGKTIALTRHHQSYYTLFSQFKKKFFQSTKGTTASKLGHDIKSSSRVLGLTLDCVLLHLYSDSNSDQANRPFIWWEKCGKYLVIREFNMIYRARKLLRVLCFCCFSFPPFSCTITIPDKI